MIGKGFLTALLSMSVALSPVEGGPSCNEIESCQGCLKKNSGSCAWFVDPLNDLSYCIDNSACDNLDPGTPASCTKGSFATATFPDLSAAKAAKTMCKVFPRGLKKEITASPTVAPPTEAPVPTVPTFPGCRRLVTGEDGVQRFLNDCD